MATPTLHPVAASLRNIHAEASAIYLERSEVIEALILAILAGEHAFILGPPGTGKSMMCRAVFDAITDAKYFEALLSKTRPAEAILGPYDIPELRDNGHLYRKIEGFLPTADFAFLDEVGKMSPTLGHDLLSVVLERRLHQVNGGRSWVDCALRTFIGASNELPTDESDDAAALWDRLLVRAHVDYLQEPSNFAALMTGSNKAQTATTISLKDLGAAIDNDVPAVTVPQNVVEAIIQIKDLLYGMEIRPSDRRWKASIKLVKASAFFNGRTEATEDDLGVLRHTLWDTVTQIKKVERTTLSVSNPIAEAALALRDDVEKIAGELRNLAGESGKVKSQWAAEAFSKLKVISGDLATKRQECLATNKSTTTLDDVNSRVQAVKRQILTETMNIDSATVDAQLGTTP